MIVLRDLHATSGEVLYASVMRDLRSAALKESRRLRRALMPRFPLDPLAAICEQRWQPKDYRITTITTVGKVASVLDVTRNTVHYWRRHGLDVRTADRVAMQLGYHPGEIWSEWWEVAC